MKDNNKAPKKQPPVLRAADVAVDVVSTSISSVFKIIGTVLLILLLAGIMFACIFAYYVKTCLTPELGITLEEYRLSESSTIWYQNSSGEWEKLVELAGKQKRIWVDYEQIPWYMEKALVAIEDKNFYNHKGVDWFRTTGALVEMFVLQRNTYGGSTITQQLIKNLTGEDDVTVKRKLTEIFSALDLEKRYDKQEIIEWYMNAVYFGEGAWGVQAAANTYFGKDVSELTLAQCASIVGITNLPTYYDPFYSQENNRQRRETILWEMYRLGYISHDEYVDAVNEDVESTFIRSPGQAYTQTIYTYYEEVVIREVIHDLMERKGISYESAETLLYNSGYNVYCCMDPTFQSYVDAVYSDVEHLPRTWGSKQQLQSGFVLMDPYTGEILALAGSVGEKTMNWPLNRATETTRAPGSSLKPLAAYAPAVDLGYITPATLVDDSQDIHLMGTDWYPHNSEYQEMGIITIAEGLAYSLNTVAAQIVDKIGVQTSYDYLTQRLGFEHLDPVNDMDYNPMSIGQLTYGATVLEMCQAFCSFVNDGIFTYARSYLYVTDSQGNIVLDNSPETIQAFKPNTAYVMTYMMQNGVESGVASEAYLGSVPVAGKTGTSGEMKDHWFVGCTPYYVAAVWTGYDQPETIRVNGNPAAQIWRRIMAQVHSDKEWKSFNYPYLGGDTGIFGNLQEKLREQEEEEERRRQEEEEAEAAAYEAAEQAAAEAAAQAAAEAAAQAAAEAAAQAGGVG